MEIISGKMFTLSDPIDSIIRTVSTASNQLVHVTLKQSETEPVEVKEEPDGAKSAKATKSSVQEDHTIRLPSGTVLRIGEEKPEPTKPGRKRKGELVIKEVIEDVIKDFIKDFIKDVIEDVIKKYLKKLGMTLLKIWRQTLSKTYWKTLRNQEGM